MLGRAAGARCAPLRTHTHTRTRAPRAIERDAAAVAPSFLCARGVASRVQLARHFAALCAILTPRGRTQPRAWGCTYYIGAVVQKGAAEAQKGRGGACKSAARLTADVLARAPCLLQPSRGARRRAPRARRCWGRPRRPQAPRLRRGDSSTCTSTRCVPRRGRDAERERRAGGCHSGKKKGAARAAGRVTRALRRHPQPRSADTVRRPFGGHVRDEGSGGREGPAGWRREGGESLPQGAANGGQTGKMRAPACAAARGRLVTRLVAHLKAFRLRERP